MRYTRKKGKKNYQIDDELIKKITSDVVELTNSEEFVKKVYEYCLNIYEKIGYQEYINYLNQKITDEDEKNIYYINQEEYKSQFRESQHRGNVDMCANLMYISNRIAHILQKNDYIKAKKFFDIKNRCIEMMIDYAENEKNIFVEKRYDENRNKVITFALPGYFEPFSVHVIRSVHTEFSKYNNTMKYDSKTFFPLYVTKKTKEKLEEISSSSKNTELKKKIYWYQYTQSRFKEEDEKNKKDENNLPTFSDKYNENLTYIKQLCEIYEININPNQIEKIIPKSYVLKKIIQERKMRVLNEKTLKSFIELNYRTHKKSTDGYTASDDECREESKKIILYMILSGKPLSQLKNRTNKII